MKRLSGILPPILLATSLFVSSKANAWEAATTHAGLTEQAALSSSLHARLHEQFGADLGLYTFLTVPPQDAPALFSILGRLNPTHGYTPDASGRMSALAWLLLGSVVADVPAAQASNHFLNPKTKTGLTNSTEKTFFARILDSISSWGHKPVLLAGGKSAADWWKARENPLGYPGFATQFRLAVTAKTPGERNRHLAGSLVSAGAMLHIMQDMGSPSRVRDDISAHQEQLGTVRSDRGSRFEHIATLAFGRLGIPQPSKIPTLPSLAAHFTNPLGTGLADVTASEYFSYGTLPTQFRVTRSTGSAAFLSLLSENLRRPAPTSAPGGEGEHFDLIAARNREGATWRNESGTCLARYHVAAGKVHWSIDDSCAIEQLESILPSVVAYGVSFIETLYPSGLKFTARGSHLSASLDASSYGPGALRLFADTTDGTRREYFSTEHASNGSASIRLPSPPRGSTRITLLFDGKDLQGSPKLASTSRNWPLP